MKESFLTKLRDEIMESQKRRHDFIIRKLTYTTSLLGLSLFKIPIGQTTFDLTFLLFIVPIIAVAFDLYIVAEDYGVKRIGEFFSREESETCDVERYWENTFVKKYNNRFAPIAFFVVTILLLFTSSLLLFQTNINIFYILILIFIVLFAEVFLLVYSLILRRSLSKKVVEKLI